MQHYWGAKAIAQRVGIHPTHISNFKRRYGLPCFLRVDAHHLRRTLYASESMILAWELAMSRDYDEKLRARKTLPDPQVINRPSSADIHRYMKQLSEEIAESERISQEQAS